MATKGCFIKRVGHHYINGAKTMGFVGGVIRYLLGDRSNRTAMCWGLSGISILAIIVVFGVLIQNTTNAITFAQILMLCILLPTILIPVYRAFDDCYVTEV